MFSRETQIGFFSRETLECLFFWCFSGEVLVFFVFFLDFLVFFLKPVFDGYRPGPSMRLILIIYSQNPEFTEFQPVDE